VLPYLAGLSAKGYRIGLISFEKGEAYENGRTTIEKLCAQHGLTWMPLMYTKKPPVLSTLYDIYRLSRKVKQVVAANPVRLIHCRSYITALVGLSVKRKKGIPFIFDMRGFWADERVDGNLWKLSNPVFKRIYNFFKQKEKAFLSESAYVISLTHNAKEEIEKNILSTRKGVPIQVIPCCVDTGLFNPSGITQEEIRKQRNALKIEDETRVISYIGSLGTWYMPKEMLQFFRCWLTHYPDSIFLFITPDAPADVFRLAEETGVAAKHIRVVKGKRAEMPLLISCSQFSLFFIKPLYSKKASSPTKQGEIMSLGIPVICNSNVGDTDTIVSTYQSGVIVHQFTEQAYHQAISQLETGSFRPDAIRQGAIEFFALSDGVKKYQEVYQTILQK
jgi:glycosyltransferase involved in cell wall biosynthesis